MADESMRVMVPVSVCLTGNASTVPIPSLHRDMTAIALIPKGLFSSPWIFPGQFTEMRLVTPALAASRAPKWGATHHTMARLLSCAPA
jgi:hypothetical protein